MQVCRRGLRSTSAVAMLAAVMDNGTQPLTMHREHVVAAYIDYNGHMNVAFYVLIFDHATDALLEHIGHDAAYREATNGSVFVVESHVTYQSEVHEGDEVSVTTQVLDGDAKRLRLFHRMWSPAGDLAATNEVMILHVDLATRRTAPWPDDQRKRIVDLVERHKPLGLPPEAGRAITMPLPPARDGASGGA